jgi:hypothetical protein
MLLKIGPRMCHAEFSEASGRSYRTAIEKSIRACHPEKGIRACHPERSEGSAATNRTT